MLCRLLLLSTVGCCCLANCGSNRLDEGTYSVTSDCPDAKTKSGSLKLKQKGTFKQSLKSDYEADPSVDFGFPTNDWSRDDAKISAKGATRECLAAAFEDHGTSAVFACRPAGGGDMECTIYLNKTADLVPPI